MAKRLYIHLGVDDGALVRLLESLTDRQQCESLRRVLVVGFCLDRADPAPRTNAGGNAPRVWRVRFYARDPLDREVIEYIDATPRDTRSSVIAHLARRGYAALYEKWPTPTPVTDSSIPVAEDRTRSDTGAFSAHADTGIDSECQLNANNKKLFEGHEPSLKQPDSTETKKKSAIMGLMG